MPAGQQILTALKGTEYFTDVDGPGPLPIAVPVASVTNFSPPNPGNSTGLTASTTHSIAGGTALKLGWNFIGVCANAGDAVTLPVLSPGQYVVVFNAGAAAAGVYPGNSSQNIDGAGAGTHVTLTNALRCIYYCNAPNVITSAQLGVASA